MIWGYHYFRKHPFLNIGLIGWEKWSSFFFGENLHGWYGCKNWLSRGWNWWTIMCFLFCSFVFFFKCDLFNESSQDWEEMFLNMFVSDSMFWRFLDSTCFFRTEESTGFRTKNMHGHGKTCWLHDLFGFGFCFAYNRINESLRYTLINVDPFLPFPLAECDSSMLCSQIGRFSVCFMWLGFLQPRVDL